MQIRSPLVAMHATEELQRAVAHTRAEMATFNPTPCTAVIAQGWSRFASALNLTEASSPTIDSPLADSPLADLSAPKIAVGPIATAVAVAAGSEDTGVIGFVAPASERHPFRPWRRPLFLDPTRELWSAGWTPIGVARLDVVVDATRLGRRVVEIVVGHARPTPEPMRGLSWRDH